MNQDPVRMTDAEFCAECLKEAAFQDQPPFSDHPVAHLLREAARRLTPNPAHEETAREIAQAIWARTHKLTLTDEDEKIIAAALSTATRAAAETIRRQNDAIVRLTRERDLARGTLEEGDPMTRLREDATARQATKPDFAAADAVAAEISAAKPGPHWPEVANLARAYVAARRLLDVSEAANRTKTEALLAAQEQSRQLFPAIAHGDDEHRRWLKQAIEDHFAGRPVAIPTGRNSAEIIAHQQKLASELPTL